METPKYFADTTLSWESWVLTRPVEACSKSVLDLLGFNLAEANVKYPGKVRKAYAFGSHSFSLFHAVASVERTYPGLVPAYERLTTSGCDGYFVTHLLKFGITHAGRQTLDIFLLRPHILKPLEAALAIGLTGEEFVASLEMANAAGTVFTLPANISLCGIE